MRISGLVNEWYRRWPDSPRYHGKLTRFLARMPGLEMRGHGPAMSAIIADRHAFEATVHAWNTKDAVQA